MLMLVLGGNLYSGRWCVEYEQVAPDARWSVPTLPAARPHHQQARGGTVDSGVTPAR